MIRRWSVPLVIGLVVGGIVGQAALRPVLSGETTAPVSQAVPKEGASYRDIAKKVLPAVVSVETKIRVAAPRKPAPRRPAPELPPGVPEEFRKFFEGFPQIPFDFPEIPQRHGFGSGFIIDPKGVILTNYHVVAGASEVEVQLHDGRKFVSKDIKGDPKTDLAIIRISSKKPLPYLELGNSDSMEIGDPVLAAGAPFGLTGSVTAGIVSAKGRNMRMYMYEDFIQTDAAINPGNSGGPLVNMEGKVIGINSAIRSHNGGFQGVSLAIASNLAKNVISQLEKEGKVRRGYLGVQIQNLDPDVAARLGLTDKNGVLVSRVFEGTPAAKAGLKEGDIVTALDGKPMKDGRELQQIVAGLPAGKAVEVAVLRDGKTETLTVKVEEQPQEFGSLAAVPPAPSRPDGSSVDLEKLGIKLADMTEEMAERLGYKEGTEGAVITHVEPGSVASLAGLRTGMIIRKVDKESVQSATAARGALEKASLEKGVLLQVQTPQGTTLVLLKATTK